MPISAQQKNDLNQRNEKKIVPIFRLSVFVATLFRFSTRTWQQIYGVKFFQILFCLSLFGIQNGLLLC